MDWNAIHKVVVPVDLESADDQGLRTALQASRDPSGVLVVYVLPELEPSLMVQIDVESRRANALKSLQTWLAERGATGVSSHVLVGRAARAITNFAKEQGADLIVMSARSHGAVSRALLGSVAERTTRLAPCPVLLMHPR